MCATCERVADETHRQHGRAGEGGRAAFARDRKLSRHYWLPNECRLSISCFRRVFRKTGKTTFANSALDCDQLKVSFTAGAAQPLWL
jgi:hypothetical protein